MSATMITAVDLYLSEPHGSTGFNNTQDFANIVSGVKSPLKAMFEHTKKRGCLHKPPPHHAIVEALSFRNISVSNESTLFLLMA